MVMLLQQDERGEVRAWRASCEGIGTGVLTGHVRGGGLLMERLDPTVRAGATCTCASLHQGREKFDAHVPRQELA